MAVSKPELIEVALADGLAQKFDRRSGPSTTANVMQNCVRLKSGAVRKRFGHTALSSAAFQANPGAQICGGAAIASGNTLCMTGGNQGAFGGATTAPYMFSSFSEQLAIWMAVGAYPPADVLDRQTLATFISNPTDYDVAQGTNGVVVLVAIVDAVIYWAAYDGSGKNPSYACIRALSTKGINFTAGGIGPRLICAGTTAILTYVVDANTVNCQSLDLTNVKAGWSAQVALTLAGGQFGTLPNGIYDMVPVDGDPTRFAMCFESSGANSVAVAVYSTTSPFTQSVLRTFETRATFSTFLSMCMQAKSGGHYWVGYVCGGGAGIGGNSAVIRTGFWNESGNVTGTPATFATYSAGVPTPGGKCTTCVTGFSGSNAFVFSTGSASGVIAVRDSFIIVGSATDTAGVVSCAAQSTFHGLQLASRAIREDRLDLTGGDGIVFSAYNPSAIQGTHYTVHCSLVLTGARIRPIACMSPRLSKLIPAHNNSTANTALPRNFNLPSVVGSGEVYAFAMTYSTGTFHQSIALQSVELMPSRTPIPADRNGHTMFAASIPFQFDGQFVMEPNFLSYPEIISATPSTTGGSIAAGTYQYIAIWEAYDAIGNIHQSATAVPVSVTTTGGTNLNSVSVVVPSIPLTYRLDNGLLFASQFSGALVPPARVVLYRTTAGGTIFYRATSDPAPTANIVNEGAANLTLVDTITDSQLTAAATAQVLYTTGGVLDHFNPPTARAVVLHKSRWFLAGCDEPRQVWPSDSIISGVCPGWNEAVSFLATGAVRALASLDDKLILFVQRGQTFGIEYVTGDGPNNTGAQSDWTPPQAIQSDSGAVDQRGTCAMPLGILYRSNVGGPNGSGGIFLLSRNLTAQYLSGPVEDTLAAFPVVTSMVLHPNAGRVYITCVANDLALPLTGVRLVWDYLQNVWSQDAISDPDNAQVGTAGARSACVAQTPSGPTYHWLTTTGRVYRETLGIGANSYTDAGSWVTMQVASSWQKLAMSGLTQYWAVQLQSDQLDSADLTMQLTYDYAPSSFYSESHTWTATAQSSMNRFPQIDVEMIPMQQKAKAIQIQLTDAPPTGGAVAVTGQGASWATLTIEVSPDEGRYPNLGSAQRG